MYISIPNIIMAIIAMTILSTALPHLIACIIYTKETHHSGMDIDEFI
jgi:hypothetical protein